MTTLIYKHDAIDIADPSSMQDACHMNFVRDLAHLSRLTLSNTIPLSRTLLKPLFKLMNFPWEKKLWQLKTTEKGSFRGVIKHKYKQELTSNRSSCVSHALQVLNREPKKALKNKTSYVAETENDPGTLLSCYRVSCYMKHLV